MKIAMFGHKHFPSREGGIEVVVAELAKRMSVSSKLTIYDRYELNKKKGIKKDMETSPCVCPRPCLTVN